MKLSFILAILIALCTATRLYPKVLYPKSSSKATDKPAATAKDAQASNKNNKVKNAVNKAEDVKGKKVQENNSEGSLKEELDFDKISLDGGDKIHGLFDDDVLDDGERHGKSHGGHQDEGKGGSAGNPTGIKREILRILVAFFAKISQWDGQAFWRFFWGFIACVCWLLSTLFTTWIIGLLVCLAGGFMVAVLACCYMGSYQRTKASWFYRTWVYGPQEDECPLLSCCCPNANNSSSSSPNPNPNPNINPNTDN